jgi:hypothetical protein
MNPGAGPVPDGPLELAEQSIKEFISQLDLPREVFCHPKPKDNWSGRLAYELSYNGGEIPPVWRTCSVLMPCMSPDDLQQGAWKAPRLYVDGNSWLWEFALSQARHCLTLHPDDEEE